MAPAPAPAATRHRGAGDGQQSGPFLLQQPHLPEGGAGVGFLQKDRGPGGDGEPDSGEIVLRASAVHHETGCHPREAPDAEARLAETTTPAAGAAEHGHRERGVPLRGLEDAHKHAFPSAGQAAPAPAASTAAPTPQRPLRGRLQRRDRGAAQGVGRCGRPLRARGGGPEPRGWHPEVEEEQLHERESQQLLPALRLLHVDQDVRGVSQRERQGGAREIGRRA